METQSTEIKDLAAALAKAQAEIKPALKDTDNPFFKSKYADLASVQAACMPHLTKNGLSVVQAIQMVGELTVLVTTLMHTSGQWLKSVAPVRPTKNDPQGLGSALTYMRRYSLASMAGVAQEDDDGNSASEKGNGEAKKTEKQADPKKNVWSVDERSPEEKAKDYETFKIAYDALSIASDENDVNGWKKLYGDEVKKLPAYRVNQISELFKKTELDINNRKMNGAH